ncbi:hypothetical protein QUF95_15485 [Paenibacillus silvae]|nr:hypothetical protein [Paenibacillus silvae]
MKWSIRLSRVGGDPAYWMSRPLWLLARWIKASSELYEEERIQREAEGSG